MSEVKSSLKDLSKDILYWTEIKNHKSLYYIKSNITLELILTLSCLSLLHVKFYMDY